MFVGLDFGTTNSALAVADRDGKVALTRYTVGGREYETFRSVLYFDPDKRPGPLVTCGVEGILAYLDADGRGRFIQSVKSHLASQSFKSTVICGRPYTLEQLIAQIIGQLKHKAAHELPPQIVVGRPVHFVGADPDGGGDALAEERLRAAVVACGFTEVRFELEPVAAAYQYESRLEGDELVLIADFGGGTTDLCLVDVGPEARQHHAAEGRRHIRATSGVALAGDSFDQRIIQHAIAPRLGLGTKYRVLDGDADVPRWVYASLAQWHLLSFLKTQKTMQMLDEVVSNSYAPEPVALLYRIIDEDLGHRLHQAVERAKVALTTADSTTIDFDDGALVCKVTRKQLESWIAPDLERISQAIDQVLERASVSPDAVDRVFMTGGTSLVPAVQRLFAKRFGADKLRGGEEMTSVGRGLALVARDVFGG